MQVDGANFTHSKKKEGAIISPGGEIKKAHDVFQLQVQHDEDNYNKLVLCLAPHTEPLSQIPTLSLTCATP